MSRSWRRSCHGAARAAPARPSRCMMGVTRPRRGSVAGNDDAVQSGDDDVGSGRGPGRGVARRARAPRRARSLHHLRRAARPGRAGGRRPAPSGDRPRHPGHLAAPHPHRDGGRVAGAGPPRRGPEPDHPDLPRPGGRVRRRADRRRVLLRPRRPGRTSTSSPWPIGSPRSAGVQPQVLVTYDDLPEGDPVDPARPLPPTATRCAGSTTRRAPPRPPRACATATAP